MHEPVDILHTLAGGRASASATDGSSGSVIREATPLPGADPSRFLESFAGLRRGFWEAQDGWRAWAGSVAELSVPTGTGGGGEREEPFATVRRRAASLFDRLRNASQTPPARLYGGFAFDGRPGTVGPSTSRSAGDAPWRGFPMAAFHLPALELCGRDGDDPLLVVTVRAASGGGAEAEAVAEDALREARRRLARPGPAGRPGTSAAQGDGDGPGRHGAPTAAARPSGPASGRQDTPGPDAWRTAVRAALEAIGDGRLEKVVLARALRLELARPPGPVRVLERLRPEGPGAFPFLFEPEPGTTLVGAPPEIVASRHGTRFHATAVAGTAPVGRTPEENRQLADRLLASDKDRDEHEIGVRDMREALLRLAGVPEVDEAPRVLRLRGMQHLLTNLSAEVRESLHVLELLAALHPTAAVNGYPRAAARAFLRRHEPFGRGWYAGPVGWFDARGDGQFVPALRSAVLRGRRAHLFAGAGLVAGSHADDEWDETELKFRPVLRALGLPTPGSTTADRRDSAARRTSSIASPTRHS